jgi:hypothetical protein
MLGSRQTRPSDPSAWPVFGLRVLSAGMVTSPEPCRAYSRTRPAPEQSSQGDPTPSPMLFARRTVGDTHPSMHRLGAVSCVHKGHTLKYLIVQSLMYSVLKRRVFTQALDTLAALILSSCHPIAL